MLKTLEPGSTADRQQAKLDAKIAAVATAVPEHKICQAEVTKLAREVFPHLARLEGLYGNTGIETRFASEPPDWYYQHHGWETRTAIFQRHALDLLEEVTIEAAKWPLLSSTILVRLLSTPSPGLRFQVSMRS